MKLSADGQGKLIDSLAEGLSRGGLGGPAITLLEAYKSVGFVASQTLLVSQPLLTLFLLRGCLG